MKTERFYRTKRSTVAHYSFCPYLGGHPDKAESMELEPAMLYSGQYRFCQFCSPVSVQYRTARKDIERLAAEYGQNLTLSRGILSVTNGYSAWLLVPGGRSSLNLYHKNTLNKLEDNCTAGSTAMAYAREHGIKCREDTTLSQLSGTGI